MEVLYDPRSVLALLGDDMVCGMSVRALCLPGTSSSTPCTRRMMATSVTLALRSSSLRRKTSASSSDVSRGIGTISWRWIGQSVQFPFTVPCCNAENPRLMVCQALQEQRAGVDDPGRDLRPLLLPGYC
jgi:hypothetical protein